MSVEASYQFVNVNQKLSLQLNSQLKPFSINFTDYLKSSNLGEGGRHLLYKAVKLKGETDYSIIDATGGWARDAFFLAQQGLQVKVIEQAEVVFRLLEDAYQRALNDPSVAPIMARMEFIHADAKSLLPKLQPKVIYLDPMFPGRSKSAKVKKDLQILQSLPETFLGDPDELFLLAREVAERVVVKRPIGAPFLAGVKASFQYTGKTVRFDVYV
jgi:16S rRNA (guanine1516-N2)-methyltransferase